MQYRTLGGTGIRVSVVGVGTWQFGGEWGREFSQAEVDAILQAAAESGINLIDTAECYGDHLSERLIGEYLARHDRSQWVVATKFGHRFKRFMDRDEDFSPTGIRVQLEDSLRALRCETIDLYQFHSGTDAAFENQEMWSTLAKLKQQGKVRHLGVSIMGKGSEMQARRASEVGASVLQVIYNRLDQRPEQLYFPHAQQGNLGLLARVPLASGLLSGKYRSGARFPLNDYRSTLGSDRIEAHLVEVDRVRQEVPAGVPLARWALAWCLKNPVVSAVIPGCKDPAQVKANAAAAELV